MNATAPTLSCPATCSGRTSPCTTTAANDAAPVTITAAMSANAGAVKQANAPAR